MSLRRQRVIYGPGFFAPTSDPPRAVSCPLCLTALEWESTVIDSGAKGFRRWTLWHATCECGLSLEYDPERHLDTDE